MFGGLAIRNDQVFVAHGLGRGRVAVFELASLEPKLEFIVRDERRRPFVPAGLDLGPTFTLHVADPFGRAIRLFSVFGKPLGRIGGDARPSFPVERDRRGLLAEPCAVAVDERGGVVVASAGGPRVHAVQRFHREGRFLGSYRAFGCPGEAFNGPRALALSGHHLYVADSGNGAIQVFRRSGDFQHVFSTAMRPGERSVPVGLALEEPHRLLVLERGDVHELRRFSRSGEYLESALPHARVEAPVAVAAAPDGRVALLDLDGERLRAFEPGGALLRTAWLDASSPAAKGEGDDLLPGARFGQYP